MFWFDRIVCGPPSGVVIIKSKLTVSELKSMQYLWCVQPVRQEDDVVRVKPQPYSQSSCQHRRGDVSTRVVEYSTVQYCTIFLQATFLTYSYYRLQFPQRQCAALLLQCLLFVHNSNIYILLDACATTTTAIIQP
jgi:hypothetical protein